jgi:purine-binding chemotaxis protein CheW
LKGSSKSGGLQTEKAHFMHQLGQLVSFILGEQRYALPLQVVKRVLRVVEITPLPKAPDIVLGVVNLQGKVLPVINLSKRFRLPEREVSLSDQLIVAQTLQRPVALLVDEVTGVIEASTKSVTQSDAILAGTEFISGVMRSHDGMILIHDLESCLSLEEERRLDDAMKTTEEME